MPELPAVAVARAHVILGEAGYMTPACFACDCHAWLLARGAYVAPYLSMRDGSATGDFFVARSGWHQSLSSKKYADALILAVVALDEATEKGEE